MRAFPARRPLAALLRDARGVSMIEFAIVLPVLLTLVLFGIELTNYMLVRQRVSQLALLVSDNSSRMGDQSRIANIPISERLINDVLTGANLQSGNLNLKDKGRVILSSVELNAQNGQWIHWQRCIGDVRYQSSYGFEGDGQTGTAISGVGPSNALVKARADIPVMFVEIAYGYTPVTFSQFAPSNEIREVAALAVRDSRDTSTVYNPDNAEVSACARS